jgi:hypothetical protein
VEEEISTASKICDPEDRMKDKLSPPNLPSFFDHATQILGQKIPASPWNRLLAMRTLPIRNFEYLASIPYEKFLLDGYWGDVRAAVLERDENQCQLCLSESCLQVHHKTYEHRGLEHIYLDDLITLCVSCHQKFHDIKTGEK